MARIHTTDAQARYAARKMGLRICKSRDRCLHTNNHGGYQLIDTYNNVVAGRDFDLSAEDVVTYAWDAGYPIGCTNGLPFRNAEDEELHALAGGE